MPVIGSSRLWLRGLLAGLAYGGMTILAFPPIGWSFLVLASIFPLVWLACAVVRERERGGGFAAGVWAGLGSAPSWLYLHAYLIDVTAVGYPLMGLYMGAYVGLATGLMVFAARWLGGVPMVVIAPVIWTGVEVLRGEVMLIGYPWYLLAHPTIDLWPSGAPASVLGTYFVSFVAAIPAGMAADGQRWAGQRRRWLAVAGGLLVIVGSGLLGGQGQMRVRNGESGGRYVRVAVIQTNLPQSNKMVWPMERRIADYQRWLDLTRAAAVRDPKPDLIIWPETMFAGFPLDPESLATQRRSGIDFRGPAYNVPNSEPGRMAISWFADELLRVQQGLGVPILMGATAEDEGTYALEGGRLKHDAKARYNSAILIRDGRPEAERYDKLELTPFGEVIPFAWRFQWLQDFLVGLGAAGMKFDLAFGQVERVFKITAYFPNVIVPDAPTGTRSPSGQVRVITPICFEATYARVCRRLAYGPEGRRADVIVNLSNDGWFGPYGVGRPNHLLVCRWRCVELGLPMVRAVNTGISAVIDAYGRVIKTGPDGQDPAGTEGVLWAEAFSPVHHGTIYGRIGDVFGWSMLGLTTLVGGWGGWGVLKQRAERRQRKTQPSAHPAPPASSKPIPARPTP